MNILDVPVQIKHQAVFMILNDFDQRFIITAHKTVINGGKSVHFHPPFVKSFQTGFTY